MKLRAQRMQKQHTIAKKKNSGVYINPLFDFEEPQEKAGQQPTETSTDGKCVYVLVGCLFACLCVLACVV
eukprot:m.148136 g.148136  ORF g.148136 m.148136 type:complete len:70 (+) comp13249_c0_seq3:152-361(+)